jgi:hypothetical protein
MQAQQNKQDAEDRARDARELSEAQGSKRDLILFARGPSTVQELNHYQATTLHLVEMIAGSLAVTEMKICFNSGYPQTQHNTTPGLTLSRREIARCDAILKQVDKGLARDAAIKAKKDAEYDERRPVK